MKQIFAPYKKVIFVLLTITFLLISISGYTQCLASGITFSSQSQIDDFSTNYLGCTEILGNVTINNGNVTNLNGLSNVTSIGGYLRITNTNTLVNLTGLDNLTTIGGYFLLADNTSVANMSGLDNLTTVGGFLNIGYNNVTSLVGLESLTTVGGTLAIQAMPSMNTIAPLNNLNSIGGLVIINMDVLSNCEIQVICDYLDNGGSASLGNNGTGCNSVAEIQAACLLLLPVELIEFNGRLFDNQIHLNWLTSSEVNNLGFELQKSRNGVDWQLLNEIEGQGTTTESHQYKYIDTNPFLGLNYYRLKQIDFDGAFEYSDVISVNNSSKREFQIYPNPVTDKFNIVGIQEGEIVITDNMGKTVMQTDFMDSAIDISALPSGIYFVKVSSSDDVSTSKLVKL